MAAHLQIGGTDTDRIFLGTAFTRKFHVKDIDTDATGLTAKDMTGKTVVLDIRTTHKSTATLLTATLTVAGVFNTVAASNLQRLQWACAYGDLTTAIFGPAGGTFAYSVKTTDSSKTVLQWGDVVIERATQV